MLGSCREMSLTATVVSCRLTVQGAGLMSLLPKGVHILQNN